RLGQDDETPLKAAWLHQPLDALARGVIKLVVDADDQMRRHHKVLEAFGDQPCNLSERLGGRQTPPTHSSRPPPPRPRPPLPPRPPSPAAPFPTRRSTPPKRAAIPCIAIWISSSASAVRRSLSAFASRWPAS